MTRSRGAGVRAHQREHVRERAAIERAYARAIRSDDSFADLVVGEQAKVEPYHRWLPFRQQFAPGLVRRFLSETGCGDPVLDPFSGSGTVVIECARLGRAGIGVEGLPVLAWLTGARFRPEDDARLADILAAGRTVTGEGRRRETRPLADLHAEVGLMIAEDRLRPLRGPARIAAGDARRLPLPDRSIGGVLTSPPYLSRYDYTRITAVLDDAWRRGRPPAEAAQMRAALKVRGGTASKPVARDDLPAAALEAADAVEKRGRRGDARTIHAYFVDLMQTLSELHRVTRPGAPAWIVIGAADFEREYIPSDLIAAELGIRAGFEVEGVVVARRLRESGRLLGDLRDVAPRESIVKLVHPGALR